MARQTNLTVALTGLLMLAGAGSAAAAPFPHLFSGEIPPPQGMAATCAGLGGRSPQNVDWRSFPLRVEVEGSHGQYVGDQSVTITSATSKETLGISCSAPWVLMRLPPGRYVATAQIPSGASETRSVTVPANGTTALVYRFSESQRTEEQSP